MFFFLTKQKKTPDQTGGRDLNLPLHLPDILGDAGDLVGAQIEVLEVAQFGDLFGEVGQLVAAQIEFLERGGGATIGIGLFGEQRFGQRGVGQQVVLGNQGDQWQLAHGIRQRGDGIGAKIQDLQVGELHQEAGQANQPVVVEQHGLDIATGLQQGLLWRGQVILEGDQIEAHAPKVQGLLLPRIRVRAIRRVHLHGYGSMYLSVLRNYCLTGSGSGWMARSRSLCLPLMIEMGWSIDRSNTLSHTKK